MTRAPFLFPYGASLLSSALMVLIFELFFVSPSWYWLWVGLACLVPVGFAVWVGFYDLEIEGDQEDIMGGTIYISPALIFAFLAAVCYPHVPLWVVIIFAVLALFLTTAGSCLAAVAPGHWRFTFLALLPAAPTLEVYLFLSGSPLQSMHTAAVTVLVAQSIIAIVSWRASELPSVHSTS